MVEICREIDEWIEEEITRPVEEWVERQEERCREEPCNWWMLCLNKLVCWLVTVTVKVVTWVTDIVGRWITRTICTIISLTVMLLISVTKGLIDVIVGIFTLDWARIVDGFFQIFGSIIEWGFGIFRVVTLGDTIAFIIDEINKGRLRNHVRTLLEEKYSGDILDEIKDALSVDHGAFGWRTGGRAVRVFVDSHSRVDDASETSDLLALHENGDIDLFELAGFEWNSYWNRSRYYPVHKGTFLTGGGGLLTDDDGIPRLTRDELQTYIDTRGAEGPEFLIFPLSKKLMDAKLRVTNEKGRQLGLMFHWEQQTVEISELDHIIQPGSNCCGDDTQVAFLRDKIGRQIKVKDAAGSIIDETDALQDLCEPVTVAVFRYEDMGLNGLGTILKQSQCIACADCGGSPGLSPNDNSGSTFKDRLPDIVWKYVQVHELGHYYGLCHVPTGIERIMYSGGSSNTIGWRTFLDYFYLRGEPTFILDEAMQVWDYIVMNVPADCLSQRHD